MALDFTPALAGSLLAERRRRAVAWRTAEDYYDGKTPFPQAVIKAKLTKAYKILMPMATTPWGSLIVDSSQDRLEVAGLLSPDPEDAKRLWANWQDNGMDAESKLAHHTALIGGRCTALVWPDAAGQPDISLDTPDTMVVKYAAGRRRPKDAVAALRHWVDEEDDLARMTIYTEDAIYKFIQSKKRGEQDGSFEANGDFWQPRQEPEDDEWPVVNLYGRVPAVELAVNRRLKPGVWPYARGEYEHLYGLLDRINLLTFLGLVVAIWLGFPLRGVIGDKIVDEVLVDDAGAPILDPVTQEKIKEMKAPFDAEADAVFQLENPNAKIAEFKAAERKNLSVFAELDQLAVVSKTPRHYFPMENGMSNLAAEAIMASEGGMHAKIGGQHKPSLGEGWEAVNELCGIMLPEPVVLPRSSSIEWKDHESRSMAERVDAATKIAAIEGIPFAFIAERFLNLTQDEITRLESMGARSPLMELMRDPSLREPVATPDAEPVGAGSNGTP